MIIAIDFDGTIVSNCFPEIGEPLMFAVEAITKLKENGYKLILWTCRTDLPERKYLTEAVEFCESLGLKFDAINDNLPEAPYRDVANCRKVYADFYIDDKSIQPNWSVYFE
jgi:histidinol phosphatase-like enzyme